MIEIQMKNIKKKKKITSREEYVKPSLHVQSWREDIYNHRPLSLYALVTIKVIDEMRIFMFKYIYVFK